MDGESWGFSVDKRSFSGHAVSMLAKQYSVEIASGD